MKEQRPRLKKYFLWKQHSDLKISFLVAEWLVKFLLTINHNRHLYFPGNCFCIYWWSRCKMLLIFFPVLEKLQVGENQAWVENIVRRVPDWRHVTSHVSRTRVSKLSTQQSVKCQFHFNKNPKIVHFSIWLLAINGFDGAVKCSFHYFKVSI